jgi:two-component system nitrate/nitrite response regulator NarL
VLDEGATSVACVVHDERPQARRRLTLLVQEVAGSDGVVVAEDPDDLLARLAATDRAMAVLGLAETEPTGLATVRRVLTEVPGAAVLVAGSAGARAPAQQAVVEGAAGFLRWDAPRTMIRTLVRSVAATAAGEDLLPSLAPAPRSGAPERGDDGRDLRDVVVDPDTQRRLELSVRELQVLIGVSRGLTNADIGRRLYLSDHTVKSHTGHLFRKLGAADRAQAVSHAWRLGLFVPAPARRVSPSP